MIGYKKSIWSIIHNISHMSHYPRSEGSFEIHDLRKVVCTAVTVHKQLLLFLKLLQYLRLDHSGISCPESSMLFPEMLIEVPHGLKTSHGQFAFLISLSLKKSFYHNWHLTQVQWNKGYSYKAMYRYTATVREAGQSNQICYTQSKLMYA